MKSKRRSCLPEGVVEGHRVDDVGVLVKRKQLLARVRVPHLARAVVAACDELAAAFVEGAIREREQVRSQHFEKPEALVLVLLLLLDQLLNQLLQLRLASLRDQRLLQQNLVDQPVDVRPATPTSPPLEISRTSARPSSFCLTPALIAQNRKWREIAPHWS